MTVTAEHWLVAWRWMSVGIRRAFLYSVIIHCLLFLVVEIGARAGWWQHRLISGWLVTSITERQARDLTQAMAQAEAARVIEQPLVFLDVDPSQATTEAPDTAVYYAAANSRAANPDPTRDMPLPRIDGAQTKVPKTITVVKPAQLQPAPPMESLQPFVAMRPKPVESPAPRKENRRETDTALQPGDLLMAKPAPDSRQQDGRGLGEPAEASARAERPRTFAQARVQQGRSAIEGEKMKQEGGVKRFAVESSLDARSTTYGKYDAAVIAAIKYRWDTLLEERSFALERSGKVIVNFRMKHDGSVHDLEVMQTEVGDLLALVCQKAIADPAPFGPWPREMRLELGDYRTVRFTFHYN